MRATAQRIGVAGLGYMGLASALSFARMGHTVVGYDVSPEARARVRQARAIYHEKGLAKLLRDEVAAGRFGVVDTVEELVGATDGVFVCVPTPSSDRGAIDLSAIRTVVRELGQAFRGSRGFRVVVVKSTVVPGTASGIVEPLLRRSAGARSRSLAVASNPEFLSEGTMVRDALHPQRIVVGTTDPRARAWLERIYRPFEAPVVWLAPSGAELVKYASNAFLAMKVSFANELARLSERAGVDIEGVVDAVGRDPRIGGQFLRAGPGFGGSCFRKDLLALRASAAQQGIPLRLWDATLRANEDRVDHVRELALRAAGSLRGKEVALLGLAFKAGTDDVRDSQAFPILRMLVDEGARVRAQDPVAIANFTRTWKAQEGRVPPRVRFVPGVVEAVRGSDLAIVHTDWPIYATWKPAWSRSMRHRVVVDTRRSLPREVLERQGVRLLALGVGTSTGPSRSRRGRGR